MKVDGLMDRNSLRGSTGDAMHAILCAAGQNLPLLLRAIAAFLRLNAQTLLAWLQALCGAWMDPLLTEILSDCGMQPERTSSQKTVSFKTD